MLCIAQLLKHTLSSRGSSTHRAASFANSAEAPGFERGNEVPPAWEPASEKSYGRGRYSDATVEDFEMAERFCHEIPPDPARPVPSNVIDIIRAEGSRAWGIEYPSPPTRFRGQIENISRESKSRGVVTVKTRDDCGSVCLLSDLPVMAGWYDVQGKEGFYFEVKVLKMDSPGIIAIGTACRPYPAWRFPGWNRLSAGLHLDDKRKFFEDPNGGRNYANDYFENVQCQDIIGCGYEFATGNLFYTYNGTRLPVAFSGIYIPRRNYDVFAALGVERACEFEVNFGGEFFRWAAGNEWQWKVDGLTSRLSDESSGGEELPAYSRS